MIQPERVHILNRKPERPGQYVLYWMQASQRAEYNHALEYALHLANQRNKPLVVGFGLTDTFPEANLRHYRFMLEGLRETQAALRERGIQMAVRLGQPDDVAVELAHAAALAVTDRGYLRIQRRWRASAAERMACPLIQVEGDVVVPVETASAKEEYSAATLRPKIHRRLAEFLVPLREGLPRVDSLGLNLDSVPLADESAVLSLLNIDRSVPPSPLFRGGTAEAKHRLAKFVRNHLRHYADLRNDPNEDAASHMSPYLHFGQISPLYIALEVQREGGSGAEAYLEELIVRRELSMNFVFYNPHYDSPDSLPSWALKTLAEHEEDAREYLYSRDELERGQTHDTYWNAAQREMIVTGKMHGYMRMYWGKKILEWTPSAAEAFRIALYLNNKYELDGRDPNGFAGVAWCFGKHDRPWASRPVFGSVRYINANGLRRKFDADAYVRKVQRMAAP
ncbi:MAG: deoxyribodipyrimidine photo-lyase [Anaerolineae bacterium]|nr:deoxyribodipyrimidine photo-lyase [Anaerolineae bacterium]